MSGRPPPASNSGTVSDERINQAKRRRVQNHSSEPTKAPIGPRQLKEGFTVERYRVGAPPLQILPLDFIDVDPNTEEKAAFEAISSQVEQILIAKGVDADMDYTEVCHRPILGETESGVQDLTIAIDANWKEDTSRVSWLLAVEEIRSLLLQNAVLRDVKVEIISWEATQQRRIEAIAAGHPLVGAWRQINPHLHTIIGQFPKLNDLWKTIDVLRIGWNETWGFPFVDPPLVAVVSITVDWDLNPQDWEPAERRIRALLTEHGFPKKLPIGADLGPAKDFETSPGGTKVPGSSGTFGGYIDVYRGHEAPLRLGLTTYRSVRECVEGFGYEDLDPEAPEKGAIEASVPPKSPLSKLDESGMGPEYAKRDQMILESPSRRKHNHTLQSHASAIQKCEKELGTERDVEARAYYASQRDDETKKYNKKKAFFDNGSHHLGRLWMCSGLRDRSEANGRLDYALIEMEPERIGDNTIPPQSSWPGPRSSPPGYVLNRLIKGVASPKDLRKNDNVFKVGSRTGARKLNGVKSDMRMDTNGSAAVPKGKKGYSSEHCLVSPGPLSDSGSLVLDDRGQWVGVLFGRPRKGGVIGDKIAYMMEAQPILDHMQETTKEFGYQFKLAA